MSQTFDAVLEHALNFSRIHGWVVQLEDEIQAVKKFFQENESEKEQYQEAIKVQLAQVTSVEEKLLLLVFLYQLEVPIPQVAELFLTHLDGRLSKTEKFFLNKNFFQGKAPIPTHISKEITDREFLSYQRAIYTALQISHFESEFDAAHVVLALVHHLCISGMLAPNRAMIFLLLSRIDATLSPGLEAMVKSSVQQLEGVIREVESRKESVLKDSMESDLRTASQYDWLSPLKAPAKPTKRSPLRLEPTPPNPPHDWSNVRDNLKPLEARPTLQFPDRSPAVPTPISSGHEFGHAQQRSPQTPQAPLPPLIPGADTPQKAWQTEIPSPSLKAILNPEKGTSEKEPRPEQKWARDLKIDTSSQINNDSGETGPHFTIHFNRTTNELEAMLLSLKEAEAAQKKDQITAPPSQGEATISPTKHPFQIPKKFIWLTLGGLLILGILFLAVRCGKGPQSAAAQPETPAVAQNIPTPPHTPEAPAPHKLPSENSDLKQPPLDPSLKIMEGQTFWIPKLHDTLWKLYMRIQNKTLTFPGSDSLVTPDWAVFLNQLTTLNPNLTNPDKIIPKQQIRLN